MYALLLQTLQCFDRGRSLGCGTAHQAAAMESYIRDTMGLLEPSHVIQPPLEGH
jgi:hypothetical protein